MQLCQENQLFISQWMSLFSIYRDRNFSIKFLALHSYQLVFCKFHRIRSNQVPLLSSLGIILYNQGGALCMGHLDVTFMSEGHFFGIGSRRESTDTVRTSRGEREWNNYVQG